MLSLKNLKNLKNTPALALLVSALLCPPGVARDAALRISPLVYENGRLEAAASDLVVVYLSRAPGVEVVERSRLELVFGEWEAASFQENDAKQIRLGALFDVDYFVFVSRGTAEAGDIVEIVDARTGELAATETLTKNPSPAHLAAGVQRTVEAFLAQPGRRRRSRAGPVAFASPTVQPDSDELRSRASSLLAGVKSELEELGRSVVHRTYDRALVEESLRRESGFLRSDAMAGTFLGAGYVVAPSFLDEGSGAKVSLVVVETRRGKRLGQREFAPESLEAATASCSELAAWIDAVTSAPPIAPEARTRNSAADRVLEPETLSPLYEGILLYNGGRYLEAVSHFERSIGRDDRFVEPYLWMRLAYEASTFTEIGAAIATYMEERNHPWLGLGNPRLVHAAPGISFLGVTAGASSTALASALSVVLVDLLHETTQRPVFLPEDMSHLQREYDLLLGLENVEGVTWKEAPPLLFDETVSARLETSATGGFALEMRTTEQLDPRRQRVQWIYLGEDHATWKERLRLGLTKEKAPLSPKDLPPLAVHRAEAELVGELERGFRDDLFLELLARNPSQLRFLPDWRRGTRSDLWHSVDFGLKRWLVRTLPGDDPMRPWHELVFLSEFHAPGHQRLYPGISHGDLRHDYAGGLRAIATSYSSHPAAWVARFNLLLDDLDESRLEAARSQLEALIAEQPPEIASRSVAAALKKWRVVLAIALGEPHTERDIPPLSGYLRALYQTKPAPEVFVANVWGESPNGQAARSPSPEEVREEVRLRLALFPSKLRQARYEPPILAAIIREHPRSELALDLVVQFLSEMNTVDWREPQGWGKEELLVLYEALTDGLLSRFEEAPLSRGDDLVRGVRATLTPSVVFDWMKGDRRLDSCRRRLKAAVLDVLRRRAAYGLDEQDVQSFTVALDVWPPQPEPELDAILLDLARESWKQGSARKWLDYIDWKRKRVSRRAVAALQSENVEKLRDLQESRPGTEATLRFYSQFALDLFQGGSYREAESLYEEMLSWDIAVDEGVLDDVALLRTNGFLVLALIRQQSGDIPGALRMAQRAVEESSDRELPFLYCTYPSRGSRNGMQVKPHALDIIQRLRSNPRTRFVNPFGDPNEEKLSSAARE